MTSRSTWIRDVRINYIRFRSFNKLPSETLRIFSTPNINVKVTFSASQVLSTGKVPQGTSSQGPRWTLCQSLSSVKDTCPFFPLLLIIVFKDFSSRCEQAEVEEQEHQNIRTLPLQMSCLTSTLRLFCSMCVSFLSPFDGPSAGQPCFYCSASRPEVL